MSDAVGRDFDFDVFLSHASEDKGEVRAFARRLEMAGLSVWLDEEQLAPGFDPKKAIPPALRASRHVLIWVTGAWLRKPWTEWELKLFSEAEKGEARRVVPVLRVPWDNAVLGPYLTPQVAISPDSRDDERVWLAVCGIRGTPPGKRETWAEQARLLHETPTADTQASLADPISSRLEATYARREELTVTGADTTEINQQILELRRKLRRGATLKAGEFLGDGRFRLVEEIGRGGFATVWKAYDREERELVAVKVLHGQFEKDASRRERLFRGARRMASLQHANIVRVLVPEGEEQGFYYYVMELVSGGDLYRAVVEKRLSADQTLDVIESIAGTLDVAHREGLVHRDVKPQNILLRVDGTPALSDFDLVQAMDTTGGTCTGPMGTVLYAAPEQNDDASRVDQRADIFSLGMTAVFCVHGGNLPSDAMYDRKAFLANLQCEDCLRAVLREAVARRPGDRFQSMRDHLGEDARDALRFFPGVLRGRGQPRS